MTLSQIPPKLHEHRSGSWRKKLRRTILEEQLPVSRKTAASKIGDGVISLLRQLWCHCNPDQIFIFVLLFQSCKLEYFKVAWYSFSGSIPPKFEHKLSRHKQRFVKNCHHNCMRQRLNELNPFARSKAVLVVWCKAFRYWDNQICSCIFFPTPNTQTTITTATTATTTTTLTTLATVATATSATTTTTLTTLATVTTPTRPTRPTTTTTLTTATTVRHCYVFLVTAYKGTICG